MSPHACRWIPRKYLEASGPLPDGITKARSNPLTAREHTPTKSRASIRYFQSFFFKVVHLFPGTRAFKHRFHQPKTIHEDQHWEVVATVFSGSDLKITLTDK